MAVLHRPRTEGAHWYTPNGEPVHTRPNKDGQGEHNTHLGDARKLRLFPSVTNYLGILAKPGLQKWKITQVLLAMHRTPQKKNEAKEVYLDRVVDAAFEQVDTAQKAGSGMHAAMMAAFQGRPVEEQFKRYVDIVFKFFDRENIVCQTSEQTIVNHEFGFAGTMDFGGTRAGVPLVLDWKTRKTIPGKPIISYEVQPMQVASYGATYWKTRWPHVIGGNVFMSSTEPGRIELMPYDEERMALEWESFKHVVGIWQTVNGYDPRLAGTAAEIEGSELAKERQQVIVISGPIEGAPPLITKVIPKSQQEVPAISIAKTPAKKEERPKESVPKGKAKLPKPVKDRATRKGSGTQHATTFAVKLTDGKIGIGAVTMPIGLHKGEYIANIPDEALLKLWKFSRRNLAKHADAFEAVKARVGGDK